MINSYETLLSTWVKSGLANKIVSIRHNKIAHMDYFLQRDSQKLIDLTRDQDFKTLLALLRCFNKETIELLQNTEQSDVQRTIINNVDNSSMLSNIVLNQYLQIIEEEEINVII